MKREEFENTILNNPPAMIEILEDLLNSEMSKPDDQKDFDRIAALSSAISRAYISKESQKEIVCSGINQILQKNTDNNRKKIKRSWKRPLAVACACIVVLLGANAWTFHVTGSTLWQLAYSFFSDHVEYQLPSQINGEFSNTGQSAYDPYGIRTECEKDGFSPLVPKFIPEGFKLTEVVHHTNGTKRIASFTFINDNQLMSLDYEYYETDDPEQFSIGIPSDQHNISELERNGVIITISCEDGQYNAQFVQNQTIYGLFTENVDYTVSESILNSIFE